MIRGSLRSAVFDYLGHGVRLRGPFLSLLFRAKTPRRRPATTLSLRSFFCTLCVLRKWMLRKTYLIGVNCLLPSPSTPGEGSSQV